LLNDTMDVFDGARTHDLHMTSQTCNPLRHVRFISHSNPFLGPTSTKQWG